MSDWMITYVGEGVVPLEGVGVFARFTTAVVAEDVAKGLQSDKSWQVTAPGATPAPAPAPAPAAKEEPKKEEPKKDDKAEAKKDEGKKDEKKDDAKAKADEKKDDKGGKK